MIKRVLASLAVLAACAALWTAVRSARAPRTDDLLGLWMLEDPKAPADPMHFYYFHEGGHGLYRYGQVGHNATHSFDWRLEGDKLSLLFRKTGERAATKIVLGRIGDRRSIELVDDPRAEKGTRYRFVPSNLDTGPLSLHADGPAASDASAINGRMWVDFTHYATGGEGFSMYQLSDHPAYQGWKLGWHHRGDFDDWTTELLVYRLEPSALRLRFILAEREAATGMSLEQVRDRRVLTLTKDPRNFLAPGKFADAGPSF